MKNNIGQLFTKTTFTDVDPFLEIFHYIFALMQFYLTKHASDVACQGFSILWICIDLIFHIASQKIV